MDPQTARAIVQSLYNAFLNRDPEEPTWTIDADAMVAGWFTPAMLQTQILLSAEYAALHAPPPPPPPLPPPDVQQPVPTEPPPPPPPPPPPAPVDVPPPVVVPPPIVPPPQPTTGALTFAVTNNLLQPAGGLTVTLSRDVGSGTTRTTDNAGLAVFTVPIGVVLDWTVDGGAYQTTRGTVSTAAAGNTVAVVMQPIGPPPGIPIGPQPAHLRVTLHNATTGAPIPIVSVRALDGAGFDVSGLTDATGFLDLLVPLGVVSLELSAAGYVSSSLAVTVAANMDLALVLAPAPIAPPPGTTPPGTTPPVATPPGTTPGGTPTAPADDSHARPAKFTVPPVQFDEQSGVRSIRPVSLAAFDVPTFGFSPGGLFATIISGIVGLFSGGGSGGDFNKLEGRVSSVGNFVLELAQTVSTLTTRSTHVDTQGGNLFDRIVGGILGPIINALASVIRGGSTDLGKLFGPITDGLKKLLDTVRHLYNTWLRPILHAIDITRQILRVLNALGLEFAGKLDAQLGRLEGKLTAPILALQSKINELRNQVNRIVTINGTLQRVTLLQSMVKHAACVQRATVNGQTTKPGQYQSDELEPAPPVPTPREIIDAIGASTLDGDGPYSGEVRRLRALISELSA